MHMHHAARRRQHGDGCHDSQGCRAPRAPAATGLAVHRGLLKKPKRYIMSFSCSPPGNLLYRMGGDSTVNRKCHLAVTCGLRSWEAGG